MAQIKFEFFDTKYTEEFLMHKDFFHILNIVKSCEGRTYNPQQKKWVIPFTKHNLESLKPYLENPDKYKLQNDKIFDFLFDYQDEGVKQLKSGKVLLADTVGLGKSISSLSFSESGNFNTVLLVCPAPLKKQWGKEIEKFFPGTTYRILDGTPKRRKNLFNEYCNKNEKYLIVNYEQLRESNCYIAWKDYDLVIYDEVHRLKNDKSQARKFADTIRCRHKIGLTATPIVNNPNELYSLITFLKPYYFKWWNFSNKYCVWEEQWAGQSRGMVNTITGYKNLHDLNKELKPIMIRRKKEDVLSQLPTRSYKDYIIPMDPYQKKIHNIYYKNSKDVFETEGKGDFLAFMSMCRLACNSTELIQLSDSEKAVNVEKIVSPKLETLKDILSTIDEKVLVFTQYKKMAYIIQRELGIENCDIVCGDTKDKFETLNTFKNNNKKVLVATDAINYGVNLEWMHILVHFDQTFTPGKMEQREGRLDRVTQKNKMFIIKLIMQDSIEERVLEILSTKTDIFNESIDSLDEQNVYKSLFKPKSI